MKRPSPLRHWWWSVLLLHAVGLTIVALTWMLTGGGSGGLGPYLRAVGRASIHLPDLLLYCALIAVYSAALEWVLRRVVQEWLHTRARWLAVPVAALAYGLTHAIYHPSGVLYAMILGVASALLYAWLRDWRALALWHVQWNAMAVAGAILLALWGPGDARTAFLYEYKLSRIEAGDLVYLQDWGWVDRAHYAQHQLARAQAWAVGSTGSELVLESRVNDMFGVVQTVRTRVRLPSRFPDPQSARAMACAAVLEHNVAHERAQQEARWWGGSPLSAFQADDLPTVLLACLHTLHPAPNTLWSTPVAHHIARWKLDGDHHVQQKIIDIAPPTGATLQPHQARALHAIEAARATLHASQTAAR